MSHSPEPITVPFTFLHSTAKSPLAGLPGTAISLAAHVLLIGAAVRGTGIAAEALSEEIAQRIYYLPPPDRMPGSEASAERLQYVEVGAGARGTASTNPLGPRAGRPRPDTDLTGGAASGRDVRSQMAGAPIVSEDSVYSILEVEESAARTSASAAPAYPEELRKAGTEGLVIARYVVDTSGTADPASLEIVSATHPEFAASVREAVPQMRFTPATIRGTRVRQAVEQSFQFKLNVAPAPAAAEHTRASRTPAGGDDQMTPE